MEQVAEDGPGHFPPGFCESTAMDGIGIGPKSATPGALEKQTGFDVHSATFTTGNDGQNKCNELLEREFTIAGKMHCRLFFVRIDIFGNEVEERVNDQVQLA